MKTNILILIGLLTATAALFVFGSAEPPSQKAPLTLTYLGNEGFLIEHGEHKILIDALTAQDPTYVLKPAEVRQSLRRAEAPFDDIDLMLATHHHHDHFDPDGVSEHLLANPRTRFVSTPQAVERLRRGHPAWQEIRERARGEYPSTGKRVTLSDLPFRVELLRLHHGLERRPPTENLGFLIELGGWKLLHIGDTEAVERDFAPYALADEPVDIALIPSWYFARSPWSGVIEKMVRPRHWVVMHLAPDWHREAKTSGQREALGRVERLGKTHPETIVFREALERHVFDR